MGFMGGLKKGGGGFLNNVDGRIPDYEFTTVPPNGKDESEWVYLVPTIRTDGADKDVTQHLFLGSADEYEISDDGKTLTSTKGDVTAFGASTPAGRFLGTLAEKGGDELQALLPDLEGGDPLNLEAVFNKNGVRVRFVQEKDEKGTEKRGKREVKNKQTGKVMLYDRTNTVISAVYELPGAPAAKGAKGKPAAGKGKAKANDDEVKDLATSTLNDILGATDEGSIAKPKIRVKLMQALGKNPLKDAVIAWLFDDNNLATLVEEGVIEYDPSDKKQIISLA